MERHSYTLDWNSCVYSGHNYPTAASAQRAKMIKIRDLAESDPLPVVKRTVQVRAARPATA